MKKFIKIIKDNLVLFIGAGLFTYNLFKFIVLIVNPSQKYPYTQLPSTLIYLVIGVLFVVFWLVMIKKENE